MPAPLSMLHLLVSATLLPTDHNPMHTPTPATDRELVARCVRGDSDAWGELVHRFGPLIYSIAARCGLPPDGRDDVYQSTFLALHRSLHSMRDGQALAKWIITTASREAWNLSRQHRQHESAASETAAATPDDQTVDALERARLVNEGLQKLGGRCEDLLRLLFSGTSEPDYQYIAAALKMPLGSIGPTRKRCLAKLADILSTTSTD